MTDKSMEKITLVYTEETPSAESVTTVSVARCSICGTLPSPEMRWRRFYLRCKCERVAARGTNLRAAAFIWNEYHAPKIENRVFEKPNPVEPIEKGLVLPVPVARIRGPHEESGVECLDYRILMPGGKHLDFDCFEVQFHENTFEKLHLFGGVEGIRLAFIQICENPTDKGVLCQFVDAHESPQSERFHLAHADVEIFAYAAMYCAVRRGER